MTIDEILKRVNSEEARLARLQDYDRFLMYEGHSEIVIKKAIQKEFKKKENVEALSARIVPLNITQKIIIKLAGVYTEPPQRVVADQNEEDQMLVDDLSYEMKLDLRMKEANRYFKLFKRNLMEIYLDDYGVPSIRNIPRHAYEVLSESTTSPELPDTVIKIIKDGIGAEQILAVWTKENYLKVNGKGDILEALPNSYGALPFIYINQATYSINPLPDDDLLKCSVAIPLVLTDLLLACKYQTWSILWIRGESEIDMHPSSIINLGYDHQGRPEEVGMIKPEIDINAILQLITNILSTLLSTKGLSVSTIATSISVNDPVSGVSKMLDNAESIEDQRDQQQYFYDAEIRLWSLIADNLMPVWRQMNLIADVNKEFSQTFDIDIQFQKPKVMESDKEKLEVAKMKLDMKLSTKERELKLLYPTMTNDEIQTLLQEIKDEMESNIPDQLNKFAKANSSGQKIDNKTIANNENEDVQDDVGKQDNKKD